MLRKAKKKLYFLLASYFRLWAKIQLLIWKPRVVVITGSSGKTTLLHLIESQLKDKARYSHSANSAYGVPFDILGLKRKQLMVDEWIGLFLLAPVRAFRKPNQEKIYVVEADCDRPGEGSFLADLLDPEVTIWLSCSRTHSANFDALVRSGEFGKVEEAIAHEFGYFLERTKERVIVNGDVEWIRKQLPRTNARVEKITKEKLGKYQLGEQETIFEIEEKKYKLSALVPEETVSGILAVESLLNFLSEKFDRNFSEFRLPPGRASVFKGIKETVLVDSSYNATFEGMKVTLGMFARYPGKDKWIVLGDMLEQGQEEQEEHERLASLVKEIDWSKVILMGPRVSKFTYPKLKSLIQANKVVKFTTPVEVLDYLKTNIKGGETILFKGARFLEGVVEHLLLNKSDANKLCRREKIWQIRRKQWGL